MEGEKGRKDGRKKGVGGEEMKEGERGKEKEPNTGFRHGFSY